MLVAKEPTESERTLISEGVHLAVCIGVYDLGTQYSEIFDKEAHKVLIMWEIQDERIEVEGKDLPMVISRIYTLSLHEKAQLRKDLESWRGRAFPPETIKNGFDLRKILGVSCQIQIIHREANGKTYANIAGIMALPKGTKPLVPENPLRFYDMQESGKNLPEGIPDWIIEKIKKSKEFTETEPVEEPEEEEEVFGVDISEEGIVGANLKVKK